MSYKKNAMFKWAKEIKYKYVIPTEYQIAVCNWKRVLQLRAFEDKLQSSKYWNSGPRNPPKMITFFLQ